MMSKQVYKMFIISICILLAGCSAADPQKPAKSRHLKVMYYSESYFNQEYGDLFSTKYPDIEVEVVDYQGVDYESAKSSIEAESNFIKRVQPDVLLLSAEQYEQYVKDGLLLELEALIQRDKYTMDNVFPTIMDLLKEKGDGKLYGLSPRFYGNALFYNKDLFAKYGVTLPHDKMTWEEILDLARRFPIEGGEKERVYGFGIQDGMSIDILADRIASTQGLASVNPSTMKVTADTESWRIVWKLALEACNSGSIYIPKEPLANGSVEENLKSDPFIMGRMAMTVDDPYLLQNLQRAKDRMADFKDFQLGIAAGPVDPIEQDSSRDIRLQEIFSIWYGSPNIEAAWDFIKYVNGDDYARIKSKTMNGNILSRMGHYKEYKGNSLEAFYALKPKMVSYRRENDIPGEFYTPFQEMTQREIQRVEDKEISLDEALSKIQTEGQFILDQKLKEQEDKKTGKKTAVG